MLLLFFCSLVGSSDWPIHQVDRTRRNRSPTAKYFVIQLQHNPKRASSDGGKGPLSTSRRAMNSLALLYSLTTSIAAPAFISQRNHGD